MTWHPLVLAIWLVDLTAWLIYLGALWRLVAILPRWRPAANDAAQLWRERALGVTVFQGNWTMALLVTAFGLLLAGISNVWPSYVPGAMCGTGVLQAMGAPGRQTLLYRLVTLSVLYGWRTTAQMTRTGPCAEHAVAAGRWLLLAAPLMALSTLSFAGATAAVEGQAPVSCCAVLYDRINTAASGRSTVPPLFLTDRLLLIVTFAGTLLTALWGVLQWRMPSTMGLKWVVIVTSGMVIWLWTVFQGVTRGVAPYVLQILYHPCPWCLFLAAHHVWGVLLYGLPAWMGAETLRILVARWSMHRHAGCTDAARIQIHRAGRRILIAALLFAAAAAGPMLWWRWQFGGWMH